MRIESGRFTIPETPKDLRICDHRSLNSVENEMHVLFQCNLHDDLRKILFSKINERNKLFTNYNNRDKVCFLYNNTDSYIRLTASFIFQAFDKKKKDERNLIIFNCTIQLYYFVFPFSLFLTHTVVNVISIGKHRV